MTRRRAKFIAVLTLLLGLFVTVPPSSAPARVEAYGCSVYSHVGDPVRCGGFFVPIPRGRIR